MTVERAAEIMDSKSEERFYGESGKQEVFEAMQLAKLALEKRIKKRCINFGQVIPRSAPTAQANGFCIAKTEEETDIAESAARCLTGRTILNERSCAEALPILR